MRQEHASEEDLLTLHWEGTRRTAAHVASCPECAERLRSLRALLARIEAEPVPERGEEYGREVWARIAPRLPSLRQAPRRPWFLSPRPLFAAGAVAAIVLAAFLAGQAAARRGAIQQSASAATVRDRVLLIAVGEHLERSEAVLLELTHGAGEGDLDVSSEQARLSDLLPANRLYRLAANRSGEAGVSGVLDDLERVLLDVRHGPSRLTAAEREALARRIDAEGVLFKVRILGSRLRDRAAASEGSPKPIRERTRV
jgi:anti-sigma factor RsiW